ncbi:MAG: hypothetical protein GQ574_26210 [Crocinitomix sp.]|nr:hypothetical protein [Crocinitomix sp.]
MKIVFLVLLGAVSASTLVFGQSISCAHDSGSLVIDGADYYFTDSLGERRTPNFKMEACNNYMEIDADMCYLEPHKDFAVQIEGKWGCMDMFGTETLPIIYDQIVKDEWSDRVFVKKNKQWFEIKYKPSKGDVKYKEIKLDCDYVSNTDLGCIVIIKGDKAYFSKKMGDASESYDDEYYGNYHAIKNGCKYGIMTISGRVISPAIYDYVNVMESTIAVYQGDKCGLFNTATGLVSQIKYDEIGWLERNGLVAYMLDGKEGLLSMDGKEITQAIYQKIYVDEETLMKVQRNGKWGFINRQGKEVVEATYEAVTGFMNGLGGAKLNGKWGFINDKNEVVIDFQFDTVNMGYYFRKSNKARARLGDECFYINRKGERLEDIPCK